MMCCTLITFHVAVLRYLFGSCRNTPLFLLPCQAEAHTVPSYTHPPHLNSEEESPGVRVVAAAQCPPQLLKKVWIQQRTMTIFND